MKIITKNKRAYHDYEIFQTIEAGIVLKGHEVKAIKSGQISIIDSIIQLKNGEIWIKNMNIPLYSKASEKIIGPYNPKKERKLLLTKREIQKLAGVVGYNGKVLIPLEVYITKKGLIKIKIGLAKLRRKVEKKQILKERDIKREMDKQIKKLKFQ